MARLRGIKDAVEEIKKKDANTAVTISYLRKVVEQGLIPVHRSGRKVLINMDILEEFLENGAEIIKKEEKE